MIPDCYIVYFPESKLTSTNMNDFATQITADGSQTFYSSEFEEHFHSKYGAKTEAEIIYLQGCRLPTKISQQAEIKIIDICYGLGYNTAATIALVKQLNCQCTLEIIALELDERVPRQALENNLLSHWSPEIRKLLQQLIEEKEVNQPSLKLKLLIGDARQTITKIIQDNFLADAIFLDPFSPPKCPQLWTVEFLSLVAKCLHPQGIIATYSCSAAIRKALQIAGLKIGANFSVGRRSPGTLATYDFTPLPPLSVIDLEHLQTRASIPFRDPQLQDSAEVIKKRRAEEQRLSILESTSQWKKRWFSK
jgi:tRNA U34 5-methylaminomethyl-2-thiouridine-forming methyltransferase MnmC